MLRPVETPTREIKNSTACGHSVWIAKTVELISVGGKARYKKAGQLLCRAVLTISSPMQIFVIMWATSGISAKSLYRKVGQASVSCCVSMRSLITAKCRSIIRK